MIRVAIVEDHAMVRQSLARLVRSEDDLEVVSEAGSAEDALPRLLGSEPDVVLLDISMPGMDGIGLAAWVKRTLPATRIVFLTMHDDDATLARAVGVGTDGYIPKTVDADDVVAAIRTVAGGGSYVSASLMRKVMDIAGGRVLGPADLLTERESEVLRLLAQGARPDDIALTLHLSVKTVKNHLTSTYAKLGVETAAQAVAEAYMLRIVRVDEQAQRETADRRLA